jgi:hypothetical protein
MVITAPSPGALQQSVAQFQQRFEQHVDDEFQQDHVHSQRSVEADRPNRARAPRNKAQEQSRLLETLLSTPLPARFADSPEVSGQVRDADPQLN